MRRPSIHWLGLAACLAWGCSLRSLDELNRCTGRTESAECPSPAGAGVGTGAQGGSGVGNSGAGGSAPEGGRAGAAGAIGGAPNEGGAAGEPPKPELVLLYAYRSQDDPEPVTESKNVRPILVIRNESAEPVDVTELSVRYYFTLEAPTELVFTCDYVRSDTVIDDCDGVVGAFGTLPDREEAKNYLELTFAPPNSARWTIPELGGESGPVQVRFYKQGFGTQNQENDYSFDVQKMDTPEPWDKVTLYRAGSLVYGIEPR